MVKPRDSAPGACDSHCPEHECGRGLHISVESSGQTQENSTKAQAAADAAEKRSDTTDLSSEATDGGMLRNLVDELMISVEEEGIFRRVVGFL